MSEDKAEILDCLVLPRLKQIQHYSLFDGSNLINRKVESFHRHTLLDIKMDKNIFNQAINKIITTYKNFATE